MKSTGNRGVVQSRLQMFSRLVKDMADKQGIDENLKATDQMAWVGKR